MRAAGPWARPSLRQNQGLWGALGLRRHGPGPGGGQQSEAQGVAGDHAASLHQGRGDALEVTEQLLLLRVRLQGGHVLPDPGCRLGTQEEGFRPAPRAPRLPWVTLNLTSIHQLSQSIFSCWAVGWPSLRDLEALVPSRKGKQTWAVSLARAPHPPTAAAQAASPRPGRRRTWTELPPWRRGQWHCRPDAAARTVHLSGRRAGVGG